MIYFLSFLWMLIAEGPIWFRKAKEFSGKKESDSAFNRFMSGFWRLVGLGGYTSISGAARAWCGLFVAVSLSLGGYSYIKNGAGAKNWAKYGVAIDYKKQGIPRGAIMHIDHDCDCKGDSNHVGFANGDCTADDVKPGKTIDIFGGNQSNTVKVSTFKTCEICEVRWPDKDKDGKPVPLPVLPIVKSDGCTSGKSSGGSTR